MSSCPCYKSKLQFVESLRVEHLLINIHSHNSVSVVAQKLEEISQKLVLGWVQFWAVPEVVFSYGEFLKQRDTIKEVINMQNKTKQFSRCDPLLKASPIFSLYIFFFTLKFQIKFIQQQIKQFLCQKGLSNNTRYIQQAILRTFELLRTKIEQKYELIYST
ncbi:Hypothetical_protein [Hexamita inflata]|uniref:Hypothetical_protein n=1 Tax=Hexamita inflata TaxID=28002 RepID=A0AA86P6R7_9EUKA|nr:Hypothetical protein HINF_LOCUS19045 [Hexamita inflata]